MSNVNRPRPTQESQLDPAELGEHYRLRDATLAALRAYLDRPGPAQLRAATAAVAQWQQRHISIVCGGFGWRINGAGELEKYRAVPRGKGLDR